MRFPKQKIDIDVYLQHITTLLSDSSCNVFIDTNIISQLYRLNDEARQDVYRWIENYKDRFHVPVWSIHEYSRRIYSNKTEDYISELSKIKVYSNDIKNISDFIKAYVGTEMLMGTYYADNKEALFDDLDTINTLLSQVSGAIKNKLTEHKNKVHQEIIEKLEPCALKNDIYAIIKEVEAVLSERYDAEIPPGFKDEKKERNSKGDLVIWKEILEYCNSNGVQKAVLLSRDCKLDMVYEPILQMRGERVASNAERLRLAHESLVYEFKLITGSNDFYIIDFDTLVKILAPTYRELAKSFQISVAKEQEESARNQERESSAISQENEGKNFEAKEQEELIKNQERESYVISQEDEGKNLDEEQVASEPKVNMYGLSLEISSYSGVSMLDEQYDTVNGNAIFDEYIRKLKSHDWYVQNPALNQLMKIREITDSLSQENIDSTFVLGRNIIQSAEGSSGSAITFMENMAKYISAWPEKFKRAMIDGMLFEIFFNSHGKLRQYPFKASYMDDLMKNIKKISLDNPFDFINKRLKKQQSKGMFVPILGEGKKYSFAFSFDQMQNVTKLKCNGDDITDTYPIRETPTVFAPKSALKSALSSHYAIPEEDIEIADIPSNIVDIQTRLEDRIDDLPF